MKTFKKVLLSLVVVALLPIQALGADCPNAVNLKVGDKVTDCDRVGLSKDYDLEVRKDLIEGDYNKEVIKEQKKLLELKDISVQAYSKKSDLWEQEAMRTRELLDKERNRNQTWFWVGLGTGILTVAIAGYAMKSVSK